MKNTGKGNYVITKDGVNAVSFSLLTNLKTNCIKLCIFVVTLTYRNVVYLPIIAQRRLE